MFCVHTSYFNLEYLSQLIFYIDSTLERFFFFSEDMLSDVHTPTVELSLGVTGI